MVDGRGSPPAGSAAAGQRGAGDGDGCPDADPDGDGIVGSADKCPADPEDKDGFQDEDGCPDPDNDQDGFPDAKDQCPNDPETKNGYDDDDGCPDTLPVPVVAALEAAASVRFEPGRPRLLGADKTLGKILVELHLHPSLHVFVIAHPDAGGEALAEKRADAVKWYLVDRGVPADQLETALGSPAVKNHVIELRAAPPSPH